jgi:hypothetical protein
MRTKIEELIGNSFTVFAKNPHSANPRRIKLSITKRIKMNIGSIRWRNFIGNE